MGSVPRHLSPAVLALALALAFAAFYQLGVPLRASQSAWINVDEPFYLLTSISLLQDGDLDLANDYAEQRYRAFFDHPEDLWYQSVPTADGRVLAPHNAGLSFLSAPAYALGGATGVKRWLAGLGGLTVALAGLLAYRVTGRRAAFGAAALLGVTAPLFVYATQIYPEMPATLLLTAGAYVVLGRRPGRPAAVAGALTLTGLLWLGTKYGVVGSVLALWFLVRLSPRDRFLFAGLLAISGAIYAGFHLATYGGLTPYAVNRIYAGSDTIDLLGRHFEVGNRLYRFLGLWIDGEFGLLRWAPSLVLAFPAVAIGPRRPGLARWLIASLFIAQFLVAVFLSITMRGWWFPGRMLIAVLPLLAVPLTDFLTMGRPRPLVIASATVLGGWSLALTLALRAAVLDGQVSLAVDPFQLAWPPFATLAGAFPVYVEYSAATIRLSLIWAIALAGLAWAGWRLARLARPAGATGPVASPAIDRQPSGGS